MTLLHTSLRKAQRYYLPLALFAMIFVSWKFQLHNGMREFQSSQFVFDRSGDNGEKPTMYTFYWPWNDKGCCGMSREANDNLVAAWEKSWRDRGWNTRILSADDAMKHPDFKTMDEKLDFLKIDPYNKACYYRWMAMAMERNGGWMSDYDTFPFGITTQEGLDTAKIPGFKSYSGVVPNIIHATADSWEKVLQLLFEVMPEEEGPHKEISDMYMLRKVKKTIDDETSTITVWINESGGFMYKPPKDATEPLVVDCELAAKTKVAHLSHGECNRSLRKTFTYPRIKDVTLDDYLERRSEAATVFMNDFRQQCLEPDATESK